MNIGEIYVTASSIYASLQRGEIMPADAAAALERLNRQGAHLRDEIGYLTDLWMKARAATVVSTLAEPPEEEYESSNCYPEEYEDSED